MLDFKQYLEEGRDAPLYHGTSFLGIKYILESNTLEYGNNPALINGKRKNGISTTRNFKYALQWTTDKIVLELDQRKISQRYKIVPYNYSYDMDIQAGNKKKSAARYKETSKRISNEYEEYIITLRIKNIDNYITKLHMDEEAFYDFDKQDNKEYKKLFSHKKLFVNRRFINA